MTLEAHAFSRGTDITASVGPFTWSASNNAVVTLTPITNTTYQFATNQVTATAAIPGITYVYASASGATSTSFQQPTITNAQGTSSPVLDFFATCPIQNIALEIGEVGSGQTNLIAAKGGTSETVFATVTDVMNNSSLPNSNGGVVLSKIPLTWSASQPGAIGTASSCTLSCALSIASPGAGTVTASCSPPTCNIGFPVVPATLSTPSQIQTCTTYFQAIYPEFSGCQLLIPTPVYASPDAILSPPPNPQTVLISPMAAISGLVTGSTTTVNVFAGSTGCAHVSPTDCSSSVYYFSTAKASSGNENPTPVPANSFLFDPPGDKIYMGSDFGAEMINPTNFGTNTSPFSSLGTVTGNVLAVSNNGAAAAFSDLIHSPNQVYIVNTGSSNATVPLNISGATTAAFSPDGLKTFIIAGSNARSLYVYSALQSLQGPSATTPQLTLSGAANTIAFSPNGAFAYVGESANGASPANITAFATCNNQIATNNALTPVPAVLNLPANPIAMKVLPNLHLGGIDSAGNSILDGIHILVLDGTGFDIVTSTVSLPATGTLCPQGLTFISNDHSTPVPLPYQRIELGQTIDPQAKFFASPDGTQLYIVNPGSSGILVYSFIAGSTVGGIELLGNVTPISSDISADGGTIVVVGSDGLVHEISTATGGADLYQVSFPNIPNYLNGFCSFTPSTGPCTLTTALVKP